MSERLTAEREAQIRCHADAHKPCDDDFHALLAELDAVRAERDALQAEMTRLSSPGGNSLPDYWTAEKQLPFVATALNKAQACALRAEATLAAIREAAFRAGYHCRWHKTPGHYCFDPLMSPGDPDGAYAAWLALLDAPPKDSADGPSMGGPVTRATEP